MLWKPCLTFILLFKCQMSSNVSKWTEVKGMWRFLTFPPYLHLAGIPCVLDRLDPADVWDAPVKERAGLANKHTQSQRRPVWFCRRDREREEGRAGGGGIREMMKVKEREGKGGNEICESRTRPRYREKDTGQTKKEGCKSLVMKML